MEFRILGPLEVRERGRPIAVRRGKERALLAILLLRPGECISSDALVDELWGEDPPRTARGGLQNNVAHLRRALGPSVLLSCAGGYLLDIEPEQVDLGRFKHLAAEGRVAKGQERVEKLREALALWRGPPLADLAFEPFASYEVTRLEELRMAAREDLIDAQLSLGAGAELIGQLTALIDEHPFRERLRAQLMLALYRSGRQAEALEAYQETRRTLVDELGIEPGKKLRQLEAAILRGDPTLDALPEARSNLPVQPTPLVGRERELLHVLALLGENRLVTLTGAGGIGKTRLALMAAAKVVSHFRDGVWFVPLAALRKWELVAPTIAYELGIKEPQTLEGYLRHKQLLLVLDNFEQLLEAAASLAAVLRQAAGLKLLVTSRSPIHLSGEQLYPVPPLGGEEARRLFAERARAAKPSFAPDEHVREICRRLDNLPLAIELAAARVKALPSGDLLRRLDKRLPLLTGGRRDAPARQQTLGATIDWSYELLTPEEQRLFARLAVFAGGCTLDAAGQVCDADLDSLASLVDKSLLRQDAGRYSMLETIREYGLERLQDSGEGEELVTRHAAYFLAFAEQVDERYQDADGAETRGLRESSWAEHDNSWAALTWAVEHGDREFALRLVAVSISLRSGRSLAEARKAFELALAIEGVSSPAVEAEAFLEAGWTVGESGGDLGTAMALSKRSLALYRSIGDRRMVALALTHVAIFLGEQGHRDQARRVFRQAIALSRRYALAREHAIGVHCLGELELADGEFERAAELLAEGVELAMAAGSGSLVDASFARHGLADVRLEQGCLEEAARLYRQSLAEFQSAGNPFGTPACLGGLAATAATAGDAEKAGYLWAAFERYEDQRGAQLNLYRLRRRYEHRLAALDAQTLAEAIEHGRTMTFDEAVDYALSGGR